MNIGFGATVLAQHASSPADGIATYAQALLQALQNQEIDITPYSFNSIHPELSSQYDVLGHSFQKSLAKAIFLNQSFPRPRQSIDLFHATDHRIPKFDHVQVIATIMDCIPLAHPKWASQQGRKLKNWAFKNSAQWADHIITISEFSAQEISKYFEIPHEKISITSLGVNDRYFESPKENAQQNFLWERGLNRPFFLNIGTLQPRKNIERLLDAFESLPDRIQQSHSLVVAGQIGWGVEALVTRLNRLNEQGKVRYLGYVNESEKAMLLHAAHALIFPSLYEGFGLPILEAFAAKLPVITSNTTAIPEVAKDAALLINPLNVQEMRQAMIHISESSELRKNLQEKGLAIAKAHTWEACAKKTIAIYQRVLNQRYL